jgi:hypothetical protein
LRQKSAGFREVLDTKCDYAKFILVELLHDPSRFEINLKVVPSEFAKFNRTFAIRNEAITFIREIVRNRNVCGPTFALLAKQVKSLWVFSREAKMLGMIPDWGFRKSVIRLLNILDESMGVSDIVRKSELLMALKDEELNDWENFSILRNAWPRAQKAKTERPLYSLL